MMPPSILPPHPDFSELMRQGLISFASRCRAMRDDGDMAGFDEDGEDDEARVSEVDPCTIWLFPLLHTPHLLPGHQSE